MIKSQAEQVKSIEEAIKYLLELAQLVRTGQVIVHTLTIEMEQTITTIKDN